jgi:hypothetical protein
MRLDWLRPTAEATGPFATVVLDATHDTQDAAAQDRLRHRAVRAELAGQGASEQVLAVLERALTEDAPPDGTGGRVLVANAEGVLVDRVTPRPPATALTRWEVIPALLGVVAEVPEPVRTVVAHVDDTGGEVAVPGGEARTVGGEGPVHKVRGGAQSHLPMQERVEESLRRNASAVAEAADAAVRETGAELLVVTGDAPARSRLRDALSERAAGILAEIEHSGGSAPAVPDTIAAAEEDVRATRRDAAVASFSQALGRGAGLAAAGLDEVVAAGRAQAIETLLVDRSAVPDVALWIGAGPTALARGRDELAALGVEPTGQAPAASAVLRAAVASDAEVVLLGGGPDVRDPLDPDAPQPTAGAPADDPAEPRERLTLPDGLGAVLRFPIA